jgi:hypothetical protein
MIATLGLKQAWGLGAWSVCVRVCAVNQGDGSASHTSAGTPTPSAPHVKSSQNLALFHVAGLSPDLPSTPLSLRLVLSRDDDFVTRANSILQTA